MLFLCYWSIDRRVFLNRCPKTVRMVLTPDHQPRPDRPVRGYTLPQNLQSYTDISMVGVRRAQTLPNSNRRSLSISELNAINNNQLLRTSAMSIPHSDDNEGFSFDNRYVIFLIIFKNFREKNTTQWPTKLMVSSKPCLISGTLLQWHYIIFL